MIEIDASKAAGALSELKLRLKCILDLIDTESRIFYIDYPVHSNIGDLLINMGTEQFFADSQLKIYQRYSVLDMPHLSLLDVDANTTFLCHGGGNFGDLYPKHQQVREQLIDTFPQARIVFLPQSLHFSSIETQRASLAKVAAHPNCHVLVRDQESLYALRDAGIAACSMMPDMAHQLWQSIQPTGPRQPHNDMYFQRRDMEASTVPSGLEGEFAMGSVDWRDIVSPYHRVVAGCVYCLLKLSGKRISSRQNVAMWYSVRDAMVKDAVAYFSCHDHVYTNRLHAMILALLLGRDVSAFDNSYGKLSRYAATWLGPTKRD